MSKIHAQLDAEIAEVLGTAPAARRVRKFRRITSAAEALRASEAAKRASDDALLAPEQIAAAAAHRRAVLLHKSDPAGAEAAWLHDRAAMNHRLAAKARASRALTVPDPTKTKKRFAAYQEQLAAATEHGSMAQELARQALAEARKRR
jgi:hypothetical protein